MFLEYFHNPTPQSSNLQCLPAVRKQHNRRNWHFCDMARDAYAFATEVARAGYATDPSYARVLHSVMRSIEAAGRP
jgi:hypothetical protein